MRKELSEADGFEWDAGNTDKNLVKHNVTNSECEDVFDNLPLLISPDEMHSTILEKRFQALGKTFLERKLFVSFVIRNNKIRIISARDMSRKERKIYSEKET